jgi:hypothetical protein
MIRIILLCVPLAAMGVQQEAISNIELLEPSNKLITYANPPDFKWCTDNSYDKYNIQISYDNAFRTIIIDDSTLTECKFTPDIILSLDTCYWRLRGLQENNQWSKWTSTFSFMVKMGVIGVVDSLDARDCLVVDTLVYVASRKGLDVINVANKTNPLHLKHLSMPAQRIEFLNNRIYAMGYIGHLLGFNFTITDVTDSMVVLGKIKSMLGYFDFLVDSPYCYVTCPESGLVVIDANSVVNPYILSCMFDMQYRPQYYCLDISGDYLLIAAGTHGILIVDISNPENPFVVGSHETPNYAEGIAIYDTLAFVADQYFVYVVNIAQLPLIDSVNAFRSISGFARSVSVSNNILCIQTDKTVEAFDISSLFEPKYLGYIRTVPWFTGIKPYISPRLIVTDDVAYLCAGNKGFMVVQIRGR